MARMYHVMACIGEGESPEIISSYHTMSEAEEFRDAQPTSAWIDIEKMSVYEISLKSAGGTGIKDTNISDEVFVEFETKRPDFILNVGGKGYRFSVEEDGSLVLPCWEFKGIKPVKDYNGNVSIKICA